MWIEQETSNEINKWLAGYEADGITGNSVVHNYESYEYSDNSYKVGL